MFEFFDGASVDWGTFEPDFPALEWTDMTVDGSGWNWDAGFSYGDLDAASGAGFDMGGVGDVSYADVPSTWGETDWDGAYYSAGATYDAGLALDIQAPTDYGTVWEADFPMSDDSLSLPNIGMREVADVTKLGTSVYGATQSGSRPVATKPAVAPANTSTNSDAFRSILGNITNTIKAGAAATANILDTRERIANPQQTMNRAAGSGLFGPRTGATQGSATVRRPTSGAQSQAGASGFTMSPAVLGLAGVAAFLALKG
jgi:hypothetical protein